MSEMNRVRQDYCWKQFEKSIKTFSDFKEQKTILEEYIEQRGHLCV